MTDQPSSHVPPLADTHVVRRGSGFPVVLIHGLGVDHRLMLPLDDALDAAGDVERIYLDWPGCGQTPALPEPGGLPQLAHWMDNTISELVGERPFAVVGNSLGGVLARRVAATRGGQVRGLALLAPAVDTDSERRTTPSATVIERDDALLRELDDDDADYFKAVGVRLTRDVWENFDRYCLPGLKAADADAMKRLEDDYDLPETPERQAPAFERPALIVTGRQDHVVGYVDQFRLLDHYPRATYAVLDEAGHNVHLEAPASTAALVTAWMREVLKDA